MKNKRRSLAGFVCICLLCVNFFYVQSQAEEKEPSPDSLYARSAVLMDADSGRILYGKEADEKRPMASTTKIMTCILALEHMETDQTAEASKEAAAQPEVHLGVREGEQYYVRDLLYSLMLESHNDSAVTIAETIAGSVPAFAEMMNKKAEELGCADTHFVTPNGLDGEDEGGVHSTTAADLARIMKYCIMDSPKKEEFLEITRTRNYQFTDVSGARSFSCTNHNAFLDMMDGALSGKTGFTADAGYCYVGALTDNGRTFIVSLLACGWPNNKGYKWKDTRALMEYGLANYEYRDVWEELPEESLTVRGGAPSEGETGEPQADVYKKDTEVAVKVKKPAGGLVVLLRGDEDVEADKKMKKYLEAPVKEGERVGTITYLLDGQTVGSCDIVTAEAVKERTFIWCLKEMMKRICC